MILPTSSTPAMGPTGSVPVESYPDIIWSILYGSQRSQPKTAANTSLVKKPTLCKFLSFIYSALTKRAVSGSPPLFALVIGINEYKSSSVRGLKGAVADAHAIQHFLETDLNVPNSQIRTLCDAEAARAAIIDALRDLRNDPRIKPGDPILIYYSGHGGETNAPDNWGHEDLRIQMLVPYDCCTTVSDCDVHGIPARTIDALLADLSKEKGDNITVILDCCFTGSGAPTDTIDPTRLARATDIPSDVPDDLDRDIWHASHSVRDLSISPGFLRSDLKSYTILAACGTGELAMEKQGRGVFTKAFLDTLSAVGVEKITYVDLLQRMHALPQQNPQCEGYNRNRILFNSRAPSQGRVLYVVRRDGEKYLVHAGAVHGITDGAEFAVYKRKGSMFKSSPSPLGTLVVQKANAFFSTMDVPSGARRFALPREAFALQTRVGIEEDLRLHVPTDENLMCIFEALAQDMERDGPDRRWILLVEKDNAELGIALEDGRVFIDTLDKLVTQFGFSRVPFSVSPDIDQIYPVICAAAHYYWHLRHVSKGKALQGKVWVEFTKVNFSDEYDDDLNAIVQPEGPNLNHGGVVNLIVDEDAMYGVKIINETHLPLYPYLFYFDNSDLSIEPYYQPPTDLEAKAPLMPMGSFAIGYGPGGSQPFTYFLREQQNMDIGFLNLFLTKEPADMSYVSQASPFKPGQDMCRLQAVQPRVPIAYDTILIPVVQQRIQAS